MVQDFPHANVSVSIVWVNMLTSDSEATARTSTRIIDDPRVRHFYDPEKRAGKVVAESLGGQDRVAWDIYLFYAEGSEWDDGPPAPSCWMHQLTGSSWADPARYHCGDDLVEELRKTTKELTDPNA
jgi:hypothetical protein